MVEDRKVALLSPPQPLGLPAIGVPYSAIDPDAICPTGHAHLDNFQMATRWGAILSLGGNVRFGVEQHERHNPGPFVDLLPLITKLLPNEPMTFTPYSLEEWLKAQTFGLGVGRPFNDTTVYYHPHYEHLEGFPEIAVDAKAVVIALGGSGVVTATGRNFMRFAHSLRGHGISLVSLDYPYHANGPCGQQYMNMEHVISTLHPLIEHYKSSGLPIYLAGHSMGPSFIQEILYRYPGIVRGAIMFSPTAGITPELEAHYKVQLASGALDEIAGRRLKVFPEGEAWEEAMDRGMTSKEVARIETPIPVLIVAGDSDPWSRPDLVQALGQRYPNGRVEILPNASHHFFNMGAPSGENIMVDRIVGLVFHTEGWARPEAKKRVRIHPSSRVLYNFENIEVFRMWYQGSKGATPLIHYLQDERAATQLLTEFHNWFQKALVVYARDYFGSLPEELHNSDNVKRAVGLFDKPRLTENDCSVIISAIRETAQAVTGTASAVAKKPTPPSGDKGKLRTAEPVSLAAEWIWDGTKDWWAATEGERFPATEANLSRFGLLEPATVSGRAARYLPSEGLVGLVSIFAAPLVTQGVFGINPHEDPGRFHLADLAVLHTFNSVGGAVSDVVFQIGREASAVQVGGEVLRSPSSLRTFLRSFAQRFPRVAGFAEGMAFYAAGSGLTGLVTDDPTLQAVGGGVGAIGVPLGLKIALKQRVASLVTHAARLGPLGSVLLTNDLVGIIFGDPDREFRERAMAEHKWIVEGMTGKVE